MRILLHSAAPWAPSGYGLQCRYLAEALKRSGHDVAVSAFGGVFESESRWHGLTVLGCGNGTFGNGAIDLNYRRWQAELMITLGDVWTFDVLQFRGLHVMPIVPIDCEPIGVMDRQWLEQAGKIAASLRPVAMSDFGRRMLKEAGWDCPVLPHATAFRPSAELGLEWRAIMGIRPGTFLISKVGVNDDEDRKAFNVTLQAYAQFARNKGDVALYLHTQAQVRGKRAPNLVFMAMQLGINQPGQPAKLAFCDQDARRLDAFGQDYMRQLYNATDVLDAATKGEGFCCPVIDALACGTPVIGTDNSAIPEKLTPATGWIVRGQREWPSHHQSWWSSPSVDGLADAYEQAYRRARSMRDAAAAAGQQWSVRAMAEQLEEILASI